MSAIDFVVRSDAGKLQRGVFTGDQNIVVGAGEDVSLNLQRSHILSYTRQGQALEITLVNGEVITLEGFFSADGFAENRLFISSGGTLSEVALDAGEGNLLLAQYIDSDSFGKWSPDDALYFVDVADFPGATDEGPQVGMLAVPLLGGLGGLGSLLPGAAAIAGGALLGGSVKDRPDVVVLGDPPPTVAITGGTKSQGHTVNGEDIVDGVTISGTGTPGAQGTITIGTVTHPVVIGTDGTWEVTFGPGEVEGGEYETGVVITVENSGGKAADSDVVVIDTFTFVTFDASTVEGEGVVNAAEESDGVVLTGTTQPGSAVTVTFGGETYNAVVTGGNWVLNVPAGVLPQGEYDLPITVVATDEHGNTATASDTLRIDTFTTVTFDASTVEQDGVVNFAEESDGVVLSGTTQAGSAVTVTFNGQTYNATVSGTAWTLNVAQGVLPQGEYDLPISVKATDAAGNTATTSDTLRIDTVNAVTFDASTVEGDGLVNFAEEADGVVLSGTTNAGSSVVVNFGGKDYPASVSGGVWTLNVAAGGLPQGEYDLPIKVTSTDAAGNVATASDTLRIDTVNAVTFDASKVEGDGIVNFAEESDGVVLSGTTNAGSSVVVSFGGQTYNATVTGGNWTLNVPAGTLAQGEYNLPISVTSTDAAGNVATASDTLRVDTINRVTFDASTVEGDGVVNFVEESDGVVLSGTTQAGSAVVVNFGGQNYNATVTGGNWTLNVPAGTLAQGEYNLPVKVTSTDAAGNIATKTDTLRIDTINRVTFDASTVEGDGVVNFTEEKDGVVLSGTTQAGSAVVVNFGGQNYNATVTGGNWTLNVPAGTLAQGEYNLPVKVTSTDAAGNIATKTDTLRIDTFTTVGFDAGTVEGDGTVNFVEESNGVLLNGTMQAGSSVQVTVGGSTYNATTNGATWSLNLPAGKLPQGEYDLPVQVKATDAAGNTATTTDTVRVDTITNVTVNTSAAGGDGVVNQAERAAGVTLVGTAEANASVVVTMGTVSKTVTANSAGNWTASWTTAQVPTGELDLAVKAVATDAAGNTATANGTVRIDTVVNVTVNTNIEGPDGVVNNVERSDGVTLTGTADAGARVQVVFENGVRTVTADASGNWSANFAASEIRGGNVEVGAPVTVTATDVAGNTATATGTVRLDTFVNRLENTGVVEGDDVVNVAEASDGITLRGVVETGSTVNVTFEGVTHAAVVRPDGTWHVDFAAGEIPTGTYTAVVRIDATDAAGNTATINDTFRVDTVAPDAPNVQGFGKSFEGVDTVRIQSAGAEIDGTRLFHEYVEGGDGAAEFKLTEAFAGPRSQIWYEFGNGESVQDGSHIVITDRDAAGNTNSTLFVLDDISSSIVDVTAGSLDQFNIGAIDLEFAEDSQLTLTLADLEALSKNDNTLIIHGGSDDVVTLQAAATAAGSTIIDNKAYDIYTVGNDGGKLIIGEDIHLNTPII